MEYDPFSPAFQADPFPVYRWMRDEAPVFYSEKWNWWALSRFDDVRAAALDPATYLSFEGIDIDDTAKDQNPPGFLPNVDNPRHDQIRAVVQPPLLPGRIAEREGVVRATVRRLIDAWRHRGAVDLAQELAWPLPNEVFFDLLGLPAEGPDRARLERWVHELKDRKPDDARLTPVAKAATAGIQSYFVDLLHERRREPRADLVTHLVNAEIDGVPFAEEHIDDASEVMGLMLVLFLGGVESTAGLVGTLFKLLAENPDQRAVLRENPALIPDAVEEAIRIATPLQLVGRTTSREVTLHGVTIPAGGRVVLVYGAANRDERRFPDPDRFDVTRGKQRHLGFGEGMHGCIGAPLARLEAKIALEEALPLLGDYTITDAAGALPHDARTCTCGSTCTSRSRSPRRRSAHAPLATSRPRTTTPTPPSSPASWRPRSVVAAKEEVADGVVALTLRSARRRAAAAVDAGRARRPHPRRRGTEAIPTADVGGGDPKAPRAGGASDRVTGSFANIRDDPENLVGVRGFEPPAPASRTQCSTRLSYTPWSGAAAGAAMAAARARKRYPRARGGARGVGAVRARARYSRASAAAVSVSSTPSEPQRRRHVGGHLEQPAVARGAKPMPITNSTAPRRAAPSRRCRGCMTGLSCRPSWRQVRISTVSSSVPRPPESVTKASASSNIRALRRMHAGGGLEPRQAGVRALDAGEEFGDHPVHRARPRPSAASATAPISPMLPPP